MHYNVQFEVCAFLFLIVVTFRFFLVRQFPSRLNRLFGIILWAALADVALDIVGSYTIEFASVVPAWINYTLNTVFYSIQVIFPALMMTYVLMLVGKSAFRFKALLYVPVAVFELMLVANLFTGIIFYLQDVNGALVYTRGEGFTTLYVGSCFYMIVTVILTLNNRAVLRKVEYNTILSFIAIIVIAMALQYFFPEILLTGVALSLAILMMFFTLQSPETMMDMISGVFNYSAMNSYLLRQIDEGRGMWLIAVDVGGIRRINSAFGLRAGNDMIGQVGEFLNRTARPSSWVFRMIGTRFLIVSGSEESHRRILEAVTARFTAPWKYENMDILLIATVRYCTQQDFFKAPEDVINLIDLAYAEAGRDGWGSSRQIDIELLHQGQRVLDVESAMTEALNTGRGFFLHYQPIYSVADGRYCSAEVLLRLESPALGRVSPAEFIPIAERTGLIHRIDRLVIAQACDFLKRHPELRDTGFRFLEINLSAAEFYQDVSELAEDIIHQWDTGESMVCFEVTETAATTHQGILASFMERMIAHGFTFALDDFGTGYANITQLIDLPFSIVKLDRSLLIAEGDKNRSIFGDVLRMFNRVGLDTVVEGAETAEQADISARLGATHIQGFHYSRPLPEAEFVRFLLTRGTGA